MHNDNIYNENTNNTILLETCAFVFKNVTTVYQQ